MATAKRPTKQVTPAPPGEIEAELLERITAAQFDRFGLRIHTVPLARDEYDFRALPVWELERVAKYEYKREIRRYYDAHRELLAGNMAALKGRQPSWKNPNPLVDECLLFPMPWMELRRIMGPSPESTVERLGAICEVDQDWLEQGVKAENPDLSFHRLRLDLSKGSKAIQRELLAWAGGLAKGRKRARSPVDYSLRLQQLAAWRARRAGMEPDEYLKLRLKTFKMARAADLPKAKLHAYEDPSTFRNACKVADSILKEISRSS